MFFKRFRTLIAALAAVVLMQAAVSAQSGTSVITGIVKDETGAAIPGAQVKLTNEDTGVGLETLTNGDGAYRAVALVPGIYRVEIELDGFEPATRRPIALEVGQTLPADVTLHIQKRSEELTVTAEIPIIDAQSSQVAQTVSRQML